MRTGGFAALALLALVVGASAFASSEPVRTTEFVPGEVIVRFKPGLTLKARQTVAGEERTEVERSLRLPGGALVQVAPGESVPAAIKNLEQHPEVLDAQPNFVYHAARTPNDPIFDVLWGLQNTGQSVESLAGTADADIDAPEAWEVTTGSDAVKVAVVDTGVEYDHPDLLGNIAEPGRDFYSLDLDPRDENGHGTHVAGTIGAQGENGAGGAGVSWNVGLIPIRVLGATGSGTTATITNGLLYAVERGARVVNASLGGSSYDPAMASAIDSAPGTLFVAAAGNGSGDHVGDDNDAFGEAVYPCSYEFANLVCVAATDSNDALASFSNYGATSVDLAAPGVKIGSTYVGGTFVFSQGTSMAAPHVAGVAALLLARVPDASVAQLRSALLGSVDVLASLSGRVATSGRLNAHQALLRLAPAPAPAPPPPASPPAALRPVKKVTKVKKVTVCFRKRTIKIKRTQLAKYKKRGAKVGVCKKPKRKRGK